jgi:hypothetical protein
MSDAATQAGGNTTATAGAPAAAGATTATGAPASAAAPAAPAPPAASSQQASTGQNATPAPPAATTTQGEGGKEAAQAATAPDKYEFKAPDGAPFDAETIGAFSEVAKELGLSQEAAQKVLDRVAPKLAAQNAKALQQAMTSTTAEWVKAIQADSEIGGEKLNENLAVAKRGVERFASPELRALLGPYHAQKNPRGMGLGNHPAVVKLFHAVGKAISEDKFVPGERQPSKADRSLADSLYPSNKS